jgi:hypothetical protein
MPKHRRTLKRSPAARLGHGRTRQEAEHRELQLSDEECATARLDQPRDVAGVLRPVIEPRDHPATPPHEDLRPICRRRSKEQLGYDK